MSVATLAANRVCPRAAWTIRFTHPVFLAIRPSPRPIMVSSNGGPCLARNSKLEKARIHWAMWRQGSIAATGLVS